MGVTGDVVLTPTTITFDDRVTFHMRHLSQVTLAKPRFEGPIEFSLYEILDPRPEEILKGSELFARYIAIGFEQSRNHDYMTLLAFEEPELPDVERDQYNSGFRYFAYPVMRYEPAVVRLAGFLVVEEYAASLSELENPARYRKAPEPILILDSPVALWGDPGDERKLPNLGGLERISLVISDPSVFARLGRQVLLEGTLSAVVEGGERGIFSATVEMTVNRLVPDR